MEKREAAERNVDSNGNPFISGFHCVVCPFQNDGCEPEGRVKCVLFSKQWLKDNPVDDWQELNSNDYELVVERSGNIGNLNKTITVRFRKRQSENKQPSHEEIMTLWWKDGLFWVKAVYGDGNYYIEKYSGDPDGILSISIYKVKKDWFNNRESATIPPEAK